MNKWIRKLSTIANNQHRTILGVMSGTSMDGIDMALCRVYGSSMSTRLEVLKFGTMPVGKKLRTRFYDLAYNPDTAAGDVLKYQSELSKEWCQAISDQMSDWNMTSSTIDLLASHGQTILHQPDLSDVYNSTWQIVDGDLLSHNLGIITVSDFRQKHIAAGYEGAPLAPLSEILLFSDRKDDRILLNLGGIANFTLLKGGQEEPEVPFATDTGPANTLMDAAVKRLIPGKSCDENGSIARSGTVVEKLLKELMRHPFFDRPFPKSTGQEDFHWNCVHERMLKTSPDIGIQDLLATLTEFTVRTVTKAIKEKLPSDKSTAKVYVSGGGWNNSFLIERLEYHLKDQQVVSSLELGLEPDAKEAALFAVLANETVAGNGWINREGKRFTLGKISLP